MKKILTRAALALAVLSPLIAFAAGAGFNLKGSGKSWSFNLTSGNNKIVLSSEQYTSKEMAQKGIEAVKANGRNPKAFKISRAKNGQYYFIVQAANNKTVASGETYTRQVDAERAVLATSQLISSIR